LNRIHWRATARTGSLHSRMYETSRVAGAVFLLDFYRDSFPGAAGAVAMELAVTTLASLANAVFLKGEQIGFASNGVDAAERVRSRGWLAEFTTRPDVQPLRTESPRIGHLPPVVVPTNAGQSVPAGSPIKTERLRPVVVPTLKGADQLRYILEALGRLEPTNSLRLDQLIEKMTPQFRRDATVIPVLGKITPAIASAFGELVRHGFTVTAIVVLFEQSTMLDWAQTPEWAALLMAQEVDFRVISAEESIPGVCAEALLR